MFRCRVPNVQWVAAALRTVESKNLQQVTIRLYPTIRGEEADHLQLQDLDSTLVQFWISHSVRPRFVYAPEDGESEKDTRDHVSRSLPELTRRGLADVVERPVSLLGGGLVRW